ncbi:hypothetical protein [Burkholderia seminalis]|uniref:hypothetical protein n=1 Tax=Burkholderia seminalis TaxID=488731 RepID=UPI00158B90DB|nr:hypothetical protein [Burkholderia seminalis]
MAQQSCVAGTNAGEAGVAPAARQIGISHDAVLERLDALRGNVGAWRDRGEGPVFRRLDASIRPPRNVQLDKTTYLSG